MQRTRAFGDRPPCQGTRAVARSLALVIRLATSLAVVTILAIRAATRAIAADWNDDAIRWRPYEEALTEAKQARKPICLVLYTTWCPHCRNYSRVFHARQVVDASRQFVMVRLNADFESGLSQKFAFDGTYIPRTYFLSPDGIPDPRIHAPRGRYKYFYDEYDPASLLAGMRV